ncbi:hypothetical protein DFH09DRAFT_1402630, partial [Mycena vulgaris]
TYSPVFSSLLPTTYYSARLTFQTRFAWNHPPTTTQLPQSLARQERYKDTDYPTPPPLEKTREEPRRTEHKESWRQRCASPWTSGRPRAPRSASSASSSSRTSNASRTPETLKMTEEQRLSLFHSFRSVKFEWNDLDGMRSVRRRYNFPPRLQLHPHPHPHPYPQQAAAPVLVPPPQAQTPPSQSSSTRASRPSARPTPSRSASSSLLPGALSAYAHALFVPSLSRPRALDLQDSDADALTNQDKPQDEENALARQGPLCLPSPPPTLAAFRVPRPLHAVCARIDTSHFDNCMRNAPAISATSEVES